MGEIEHAGTAKAMPAIKTSDDAVAGEVAGEILAEPTIRTATPPGADKVAAERGMPPIRVPNKP